MIVLVEGPDCSGKSSLCKDLIKRDFEYIHLSRDGKYSDTNSFYTDFIGYLAISKDKGRNIVIDRSYLSNWVYSTVFNDSDLISDKNLERMKSLVDTVVLCISDKDKYLERFNYIKTTRQEVYDVMDKVYDIFLTIPDKYFGQNQKIVHYNMDNVAKEDIGNFVDSNIFANI